MSHSTTDRPLLADTNALQISDACYVTVSLPDSLGKAPALHRAT
jgi:hypothetical protein